MELNGNLENAHHLNVVPLFSDLGTEFIPDPLAQLLAEGEGLSFEERVPPLRQERRRTVREDHFPEQAFPILEQQLAGIRENINRLKFFLSDLDDLIPR